MIRCRYCRRSGFRWALQQPDGWRLITADGRVHACTEGERAQRPQKNTPLELALRETRQTYKNPERGVRGKWPKALLALEALPGQLRTTGPEFQFEDLP